MHGGRENIRHAARGLFIVLTQKAFTLTDDDNYRLDSSNLTFCHIGRKNGKPMFPEMADVHLWCSLIENWPAKSSMACTWAFGELAFSTISTITPHTHLVHDNYSTFSLSLATTQPYTYTLCSKSNSTKHTAWTRTPICAHTKPKENQVPPLPPSNVMYFEKVTHLC